MPKLDYGPLDTIFALYNDVEELRRKISYYEVNDDPFLRGAATLQIARIGNDVRFNFGLDFAEFDLLGKLLSRFAVTEKG